MKAWRFMKFNTQPLNMRGLRALKPAIAYAWILLLMFWAISANSQSPPASEACNRGVACKASITIGEGYATGTETVESAITVLDIVRGVKAWDLVKAASPSNKYPDAGMEYVAVRIKFSFGAKGSSGDRSYGIRDEQFALVSESGRQYERPSIVLPKPELSGRLYPGESLEGWIVLLVSMDDKKPLMSFGNNYNRVWFKLY
jgi:hypothetical protein